MNPTQALVENHRKPVTSAKRKVQTENIRKAITDIVTGGG